jgi:ubiquinone/menaquinone biosynthesis C-methylase UbiE
MRADVAKVQADFDRIALLPHDGTDHNELYHDRLLKHVPPGCGRALEVGCGTGAFARRLARRCEHVLALDLSANMIRVARERSTDLPNIEFEQADVTAYDLGHERFDCIASIATLHHVALDPLLPRLACALRRGGVLLTLDLRRSIGLYDRLLDCAAVPAAAVARLIKTRRLSPPAPVREAWDEHGRTDEYLTTSQVRAACERYLPSAAVREHLFWRYSVVWCKPKQ